MDRAGQQAEWNGTALSALDANRPDEHNTVAFFSTARWMCMELERIPLVANERWISSVRNCC